MTGFAAGIRGVFAQVKSQRWLRITLILACLGSATAMAAGTRLEVAEFASLPGNRVEIDLLFSEVPPAPSDFATENPARIAIDFPGVSSRLARKPLPIDLGVARSLVAIEAGDRTRVVINLDARVPYRIDRQGKRVRVVLNPEPAAPQARRRDAPEPSSRSTAAGDAARHAGTDSGAGARAGATDAGVGADARAGAGAGAIEEIDFRRGAGGEGRVIIHLPSAETRVAVSEEGRDVVVGISETALPQRLFRRLEVVDFGTPVAAVESRAVGDEVRIRIKTTAPFDYLAYQTDRLFTVEFRTPTQAAGARREAEKGVYTGDPLSLNFQDIEIRAVLQVLADFTDLNLVASDSVSGRMTLRLRNVPWDQALEIILKTKGLAQRQSGNVIMVAPAEELAAREVLASKTRQQLQALAPLRTELIQINYAKAEALVELLQGHREAVAEISQADTDASLQALPAEPPAPVLSRRGTVTFDQRTNALIIQDTAERITAIRALIARLDVPVRQVLIESRVVIANNNFARDLGVRFGASGSTGALGQNELLVGGGQINEGAGLGPYGFFDTGPFGGEGQGERFNSTLTRGTGNPLRNDAGAPNLWVNLPVQDSSAAINFLLGKVGSHLITLELSAMQREGRGEIISSPRVVTADQTPAMIEVGQDIPVVTPATDDSPATVRYEPATLKLNVTPHITPDDRVEMRLEVNKDEADFTFTVDGNPLRNRRAVSTSVLVDNGETIVLGGVFEGQESLNVEKVPWLGDLPLFGRLFKTTSRQQSNQELLIFVTPKILKSDLAIR